MNQFYRMVYFVVLLSSFILLYFSNTSITEFESNISDLQSINETNEQYIEQLIQKNQLLSHELTKLKQNNTSLFQEINKLNILFNNPLVTQANLTATQTFSSYEIIVDGNSMSVVNGTITNFGLQDATDVSVEITWWILSDCGCDALPARTELVKLDYIPSSSVYEFEETFPFNFPTFQFLVVDIQWN